MIRKRIIRSITPGLSQPSDRAISIKNLTLINLSGNQLITRKWINQRRMRPLVSPLMSQSIDQSTKQSMNQPIDQLMIRYLHKGEQMISLQRFKMPSLNRINHPQSYLSSVQPYRAQVSMPYFRTVVRQISCKLSVV